MFFWKELHSYIFWPREISIVQFNFWFSILDPLERSKRDCVNNTDENIIEQWLWTALKMLHSNHVWILDMEYRLLFIYSKKIKHVKQKRKPVLLRMIQLGLHLLEVS